MRPIIKEDLLAVMHDAINALDHDDFPALMELSNHTIHDASIFQEEDPLTMAVVIYSLSKCMQHCKESRHVHKPLTPALKKAHQALTKGDVKTYRTTIKKILREIKHRDSKLHLYIQEVIEKAKIKKASKLHQHGISIARTAELLGLNQWELQQYIGKTVTEIPHDGITIAERLRHARDLFK